jgi:hypothetical protein
MSGRYYKAPRKFSDGAQLIARTNPLGMRMRIMNLPGSACDETPSHFNNSFSAGVRILLLAG